MLAETRRRRLLELITSQGYATLDELVRRSRTFPRAPFAAISRHLIWPARSSAPMAGRSTPAKCGRCRPLTSAPGTAAAEKRAIGAGGGGADRRRRHRPPGRWNDDARGCSGPGRPARSGRHQQLADRAASGVEPADRADLDRRLRLPANGGGTGPAGDRHDGRRSGCERPSWAPAESWPRASTTQIRCWSKPSAR